jgi:hypothetical protein
MARAAKPADPVADRIAVLERVRARKAPDQVRSYPNMNGGEPLISRTPVEGRLAPVNLEQWCDDREVGAFGGRRLNDGEAAAHAILTSMRTGDVKAVREATGRAGEGLDVTTRYLLTGVLADWRTRAPSFAVDVAGAAVAEARRLGWEKRPSRRKRGPEPIDQTPGRRVA